MFRCTLQGRFLEIEATSQLYFLPLLLWMCIRLGGQVRGNSSTEGSAARAMLSVVVMLSILFAGIVDDDCIDL